MSSGGPEPVCLGRASVCELPIERRGEQPGHEADPPSIRRGHQPAGIVGIREEQERGPGGLTFLLEPRGPSALAVMRVLAGAPMPCLPGELGCGHLSIVSGGTGLSKVAGLPLCATYLPRAAGQGGGPRNGTRPASVDAGRPRDCGRCLRRGHPIELGVVCEVFGEDRWVAVGDPWYQLFICGDRSGPVMSDAGFQILVPYGLEMLSRVETIIVSPTYRPDEVSEDVFEALRAAHARGTRILSLCGGAFVLAEAGLLNGRRAATHWEECDELASRYPACRSNQASSSSTRATSSPGRACREHRSVPDVVRRDYGSEVATELAVSWSFHRSVTGVSPVHPRANARTQRLGPLCRDHDLAPGAPERAGQR